jgi:hypothetical protein
MESVEALLLASAEGFRVDEVPIQMHNRELGQASNQRLKLIYHYLRLLLVITAQATPRKRARRRSAQAAWTAASAAGGASAAPAPPSSPPSPSPPSGGPTAIDVDAEEVRP